MEIGVIKIGSSLLLLLATGVGVWLLSHFLLVRRARESLAASRGAEVAKANARLRVSVGLRSLAGAAVIAPLLVAVTYIVAQWQIETSAENPARINAVVATRDLLEKTLGRFTQISAGSWVAALLILAAIWLLARHSASQRRWKRAIDARRHAYEQMLAPQPIDAIIEQAKTVNAERFEKLRADVTKITAANRARITELENRKVVALPTGDGGNIPMSVVELRAAIEQLESEAQALEAAEHGGTEEGTEEGKQP